MLPPDPDVMVSAVVSAMFPVMLRLAAVMLPVADTTPPVIMLPPVTLAVAEI